MTEGRALSKAEHAVNPQANWLTQARQGMGVYFLAKIFADDRRGRFRERK
jgi:hypothetical protein